MNFIKKLLQRLHGTTLFELTFLGIKLLLVTRSKGGHFNVFVLYVPLFRIEKQKKKFAFNLLIFSWLYRLVTGWRFVRSGKDWRLSLLEMTVAEYTTVSPFRFSSTLFNK